MPTQVSGRQDITENIELLKLHMDEEKLKLEKIRLFTTFASIIFTLSTIIIGVWSIYKQSNLDFELKTAELILDSKNATGTYNRARALLEIFPEKLDSNFAEKFNPENKNAFNPDLYGGTSYEAKMDVLKLILEYPNQKDDIINMYHIIFPNSNWVENLK